MADSLGQIRAQIRIDVRQAVAAYAAVRAQNARTVYALRGTGDSFLAAGRTMGLAGGVMVYAFGKVVMAAANFERKMDYFGAVTDTNSDKMAKLSEFTLKLAEDTIYSADQIADGLVELGKAGVDAEGVMEGIGVAMANLGAAGDIPLAQSGQIITSTMQQFALEAKNAVKVTDLLAGAANASIADISDIGVSLKYVGGVANASGLTFEDTATAISVLAKAGIRGSTAGTSLRQMIVSLGGATKPATEALMDLGIITEDGGNKFYTAEGKVKSLSQVFQILKDSTADLTQKQRLAYLRTIFNNRALSAASILTRDGAKGFKDMYKEMSKVTAADVASQRLDNLSGDIEILKGNIETFMTRAGGPFQETMRTWVKRLTRLIQAFDDLDPETQEFIIQAIAMTGATLVAMAAVSTIIGVILRFIAGMIKMAAGVKFAASMIRIVAVNAKWAIAVFSGPFMAALGALAAALGVTVGVLLLIIAAIVALVVGLVVLYKKWEPFRNLVDTIAASIRDASVAFWEFIKLLATDPGEAWEQLKDSMSDGKEIIGTLAEWFRTKFDEIMASAAEFAAGVVEDIKSIPGRVMATLLSWAEQVLSLFTFENVGYVLGFLVGTVVGFFLRMGVQALAQVETMANGISNFFQTLPAKIGYALGFLVGMVVGFFLRMGIRAIAQVEAMYKGVTGFFRALPGKISGFLSRMVLRAIAWFQKMKAQAPAMIAGMVLKIITWFRILPSRALAFVQQLVSGTREKFAAMKTNALSMARGMAQGFVDGINGLPATVTGIFGRVVDAIKGAISSAFSAVKDFAAGMWKGFKEGLGINSPSLIEKQMVQITQVVDTETKNLKKQTLGIQGLSKRLARTEWGVQPDGASSAQKYRDLASMQRTNQNRARTLAAASGNAGKRPIIVKKSNDGPARSKLTITNWEQGEGYITNLAEDSQAEDEYYDDTFERMG